MWRRKAVSVTAGGRVSSVKTSHRRLESRTVVPSRAASLEHLRQLDSPARCSTIGQCSCCAYAGGQCEVSQNTETRTRACFVAECARVNDALPRLSVVVDSPTRAPLKRMVGRRTGGFSAISGSKAYVVTSSDAVPQTGSSGSYGAFSDKSSAF